MSLRKLPQSVTLGAVLLGLCGAIPAPKYFNPDQEEAKVICGVDVSQAMLSLGKAGTGINAAVKVCHPDEGAGFWANRNQALTCATSATGVVGALLDTASFLASAASDCAHEVNWPAYCVADVTSLIGAMDTVANFGMSVTQTCQRGMVNIGDTIAFNGRRLGEGDGRPESARGLHAATNLSHAAHIKSAIGSAVELRELSSATLRRLGYPGPTWDWDTRAYDDFQSKTTAEKAEIIADRQAELSECVFDVGLATTFLVRASLAITDATRKCSHYSDRTDGRFAKMACAIDINGILGSFAFVAQMIALAISHCPLGASLEAQCAADVAGLMTALTGFAATGASFTITCGHKMGEDLDEEVPGVMATRRLQERVPDSVVV